MKIYARTRAAANITKFDIDIRLLIGIGNSITCPAYYLYN